MSLPASLTPSRLAPFIADHLEAGADVCALLVACEAGGFSLAETCELLADPWEHFEASIAADLETLVGWGDDALLLALVGAFGFARAGGIASATKLWRDTDVAARLAEIQAWRAVEAAITDEVPVTEAFARATDSRLSSRWAAQALARLAHVYLPEELASLAPVASPEEAAVIGRVLRTHLSPLTALEVLLDEVEPAEALLALQRFWAVELGAGAATDVVLSTYARLARAEHRPLDAVRRFAEERGDPNWWLPILRREALKASHAALWLLEAGVSGLHTAALLAAGGYTNAEVLTAFLENGLGTRPSLNLLRDFGWSASTMVEALTARGMLLPEIRGQLEGLGVPPGAQRSLLTACWDEEVVDLVLSRPQLPTALPTGHDTASD